MSLRAPALLAALLITAVLLPPASAAPPVGSWSGPVPIEADPYAQSANLVVASNSTGGVLAAWQQFTNTTYELWANAFTPGLGWGAPARVDAVRESVVPPPAVALDDAGNMFAVWVHNNGPNASVLASTRPAGGSWAAPQTISLHVEESGSVQVVSDGFGGALAAFYQVNNTSANIYASAFTPGSPWPAASILQTNSSAFAGTISLAAGDAGLVWALWNEAHGPHIDVEVRNFTAAAGWSTESTFANNGTTQAFNPTLATAQGGRAAAAWVDQDGANVTLVTSLFSPASGWSAPVSLSSPTGFVVNFAVAPDAAGHTFAVWSDAAPATGGIHARTFIPGTGWGPDLRLDRPWVGALPVLAVTGPGTAAAVWSQEDLDGHKLFFATYTSAAGWSDELPVPATGYLLNFAMAPSSGGSAILVRNALYSLDALTLAPPDLTPPDLFVAAPAEAAHFSQPTAWVTGRAEPGARVSVEGALASVEANGSFSVRVALAPGPNALVVRAEDAAGNSAVVSIAVFFDDPTPALQAQLENATADAQAARAAAAASEAAASALSSELAASQAEQNASQVTLANHSTQLGTASLLGALALLLATGAVVLSVLQLRRGQGALARDTADKPRPPTN